jgi:hypothetical protein
MIRIADDFSAIHARADDLARARDGGNVSTKAEQQHTSYRVGSVELKILPEGWLVTAVSAGYSIGPLRSLDTALRAAAALRWLHG